MNRADLYVVAGSQSYLSGSKCCFSLVEDLQEGLVLNVCCSVLLACTSNMFSSFLEKLNARKISPE